MSDPIKYTPTQGFGAKLDAEHQRIKRAIDTGAGPTGATGAAGTNASALVQQIGVSWTAGANPIIASNAVDVPRTVPEDCVITAVTILTKGGTGSCVIDIWGAPYVSYPPNSGGSICGSTKPSISSGIKQLDTTLTGWNPTLTGGQTLMFHLVSSSVFTEIVLLLTLKRTGVPAGSPAYTNAQAIAAVEGALVNSATIDFSASTPSSITASIIPAGAAAAMGVPLIKFGKVTKQASVQGTVVTFGAAFPTACDGVWLTWVGGVLSAKTNAWAQVIADGSVSASGFTINSDDYGTGTPDPTIDVWWFAVGH